MAISDNWGQGSKNNDNGWGKGASNNSNGWGSIHANTYGHPTTNLTGEGGFVGLLDLYPNAAFATGMRLLRADYSGGILRIIAYDGATEQGAADIMPYKIGNEYWVDFNSKLENLDATATARGLTTNDTLADLCSVGVNNYDGLVSAWYDQSLNANHATQTSLAAMPKLVDAGVLVTENGKAGLDFGNNQFLLASGALSSFAYSDPEFSIIKLLSYNNVDDIYNDILLKSNSRSSVPARIKSSEYQNLIRFDNDEINQRYGNVQAGIQLSSSFYGSSAYTYINGQNVLSGGSMPSGAASFADLTISDDEFGQGLDGIYQELIVYPTDQSANRTSIESNINNAYNIY